MIELLRKRRSIRKYVDKAVEPEKVELLKEALLRSPTSKNRRSWEFIFVDDKELLKKLSQCKKHGALFLSQVPLGIVICGESERSDVWVEDCSVASILVQMQAESLGLGSCWAQIRQRNHDETITAEDYIRELLAIPSNYSVESIIGVGYPAEKKKSVPTEKLDFSKIKMNSFQ